MFRNFLKNKKAQNTAEYALLIALVVAGIIAMQQYAQRALQARVRDASVYMAQQSSNGILANTVQYEPYYLQTNYAVGRNSAESTILGAGLVAKQSGDTRQRNGFQQATYNSAGATVGTGALPAGL